MNTTVIDAFTADTIEVGDLIRITSIPKVYDEIEVTSVDDDGEFINVKGYSNISGDSVEYPLLSDSFVALLGTEAEEI